MPTLPVDTVRDAAGGQHQRREHQAVCVDDPLCDWASPRYTTGSSGPRGSGLRG
jgi:hypothetical protein